MSSRIAANYLFLGLLLILLCPSGALAQRLPPNGQTPLKVFVTSAWRKWLNEDVVYIITDEERSDFKKLTTDKQREDFVETFWERRNPNPGSPENAFKEEHYRRIAYTNSHFAAGIPGWKTDRGRIYIMYGFPDWISYFPPSSGPDNPTRFLPQYEVWHYAYIKDIGLNVDFTFTDTCWCGSYRLTKDTADPLEPVVPNLLLPFWPR